jgi:hypothetical protein
MTASVAITTASIYGGSAYLAAMEPVGTLIQTVTVQPAALGRPELALAVRADVMVSDNCTRQTFYTMMRLDTSPPSVYPLGQTVSGMGFSAPWRHTYDVKLSIPSGIPAGAYNLVVRAVYDCEWLGVLSHRITSQAPYWRVVLP